MRQKTQKIISLIQMILFTILIVLSGAKII